MSVASVTGKVLVPILVLYGAHKVNSSKVFAGELGKNRGASEQVLLDSIYSNLGVGVKSRSIGGVIGNKIFIKTFDKESLKKAKIKELGKLGRTLSAEIPNFKQMNDSTAVALALMYDNYLIFNYFNKLNPAVNTSMYLPLYGEIGMVGEDEVRFVLKGINSPFAAQMVQGDGKHFNGGFMVPVEGQDGAYVLLIQFGYKPLLLPFKGTIDEETACTLFSDGFFEVRRGGDIYLSGRCLNTMDMVPLPFADSTQASQIIRNPAEDWLSVVPNQSFLLMENLGPLIHTPEQIRQFYGNSEGVMEGNELVFRILGGPSGSEWTVVSRYSANLVRAPALPIQFYTGMITLNEAGIETENAYFADSIMARKLVPQKNDSLYFVDGKLAMNFGSGRVLLVDKSVARRLFKASEKGFVRSQGEIKKVDGGEGYEKYECTYGAKTVTVEFEKGKPVSAILYGDKPAQEIIYDMNKDDKILRNFQPVADANSGTFGVVTQRGEDAYKIYALFPSSSRIILDTDIEPSKISVYGNSVDYNGSTVVKVIRELQFLSGKTTVYSK